MSVTIDTDSLSQHNIVPEQALVTNITHVALAFMRSEIFNNPEQNEWPLFTTISDVRPKFTKGTVIQVAIGGWGNTDGFSTAAKTPESRALFANNVKAMLYATGADGKYFQPLKKHMNANITRRRYRLGIPRRQR
jgi:GH18 family chitinase